MLGPGYKVEASYGHIRDLPKSKLGIDLVTFAPEYVVPDDSEKHARLLRREAKSAPHIWLATDLDREGEAIAWHLADVIGGAKSKLRRVTLHEVTAALEEDPLRAFRRPRPVRRAAPHRRPRARDPGVQGRGVLEHRRAPREPRGGIVHRRGYPAQGPQDPHNQRRGGRQAPRRARRREVRREEPREARELTQCCSAVHHLDATAGRVAEARLLRQAHDGR